MKYDISKQTAPTMPSLGKGTECIKILLSQASKDMYEPLVPMFFPILGAHISGAEFQYPDLTWKEPTGMMANLVAHSGDNKGQLTTLAKAICRDFRQHDEAEEKKLLEWQKQKNTKGANKDKPERPEVTFRFPPSNTTNAAFIQNAMALEAQGGLTQYFNLPEVEMADRLCGGHKQVSVLLRNVYDRDRASALRATADGVTGNPTIRACFTISSTPDSTRKFYNKNKIQGHKNFGKIYARSNNNDPHRHQGSGQAHPEPRLALHLRHHPRCADEMRHLCASPGAGGHAREVRRPVHLHPCRHHDARQRCRGLQPG
ncbi:MAG: hypothetical protein J5797_11215 [Prevotella sp.]|nr:hypothetical protein [Prevotella sp.]